MDDIVRQAMAKWPNVPHCYGWLALDARGAWRMRDERAQASNLPGDRIRNAALLGFINRNYTHDEKGRWYFQNGPQRVYVNLDATPYIVHTDPTQEFMLHTGEPLGRIDAVWMSETGQLILRNGEKIATLDDRDMAQCLPRLRINGKAIDDEQLLAWVDCGKDIGALMFEHAGGRAAIERIRQEAIPALFGFDPAPRA